MLATPDSGRLDAHFEERELRLAGRTAIVTGAARGIGLAIATRMAAEGARVVLCDILAPALTEAVRALARDGHHAHAFPADISTLEGNQKLIDFALSKLQRVDIFHANAALMTLGRLDALEPGGADRTIDVNLKGTIYGCRAVVPQMLQQGGGVILMTASVLGSVGDAELPIYGATKGALKALCRSVSVAYGPQGIRCNTISPGDVRTQIFEDYVAASSDPAAARKAITDAYPLRRIAEPDDVARLAVFLASEEASFITGTDVVIDGGLTAQCY